MSKERVTKEGIVYKISHPLSDSTMQKARPGANIISYDKLSKLNTIEEVLGNNEEAIILYLLEENSGHWTCLFTRIDENNQKKLSYFDSIGNSPDDDFKYIRPEIRIGLGQVNPHLFELIVKSGLKCEYNNKRLQASGTQTCGRHVLTRLNNKTIDPQKYIELIKSENFSPDIYVTLLTYNI